MVLHRTSQAVSGALLLATFAVLTGCSGNGAAGKSGQPALSMTVPVTVGSVVRRTVPVDLTAIGNVEAYSTVSIKSQVEGQLQRVYFQEGQDVKKGDLLFTIDSRPFQAALKQAEANLAKDTAQASHTRLDSERYLKLSQDGIASREQYDEARTNAEALEASVRADKAAVENAEVQLGYCTIRSPLDGRTGTLIVHPGNVVKANDLTLVVINQIRPVYVSFSVPERYLAQIKAHMVSRVLAVKATIPGDEARPLEGTLTFVDNAVDSVTGTLHLKGTFANSERRLWPGQFVNVVLTLGEQTRAVVVPNQALQTGQQGQYVFVVKPDLSVDLRPVVAGMTAGGDTVIEKGLQPGDRVVTDGQLLLSPGAKVEIKSAER
jgi:multidrug efflux system membrane fusion protein